MIGKQFGKSFGSRSPHKVPKLVPFGDLNHSGYYFREVPNLLICLGGQGGACWHPKIAIEPLEISWKCSKLKLLLRLALLISLHSECFDYANPRRGCGAARNKCVNLICKLPRLWAPGLEKESVWIKDSLGSRCKLGGELASNGPKVL